MRPFDVSTFDRLARYLRSRKVSIEVRYGGGRNPTGWSVLLEAVNYPTNGQYRDCIIETGPTMMGVIKNAVAHWEARVL